MEKELESIHLILDYVDESGKRDKKLQRVKVNTPKLSDKGGSHLNHVPSIYQLSFSVKIPDFIHDYLKGKNVIRRDNFNDVPKSYDEKFSKTINAYSIQDLTKEWCNIIIDFCKLKEIEKAELKKVIFFDFQNNYGICQSSWNGLLLGNKSKMEYRYCIGFVCDSGKNQVLRYNDQKRLIHSYYDKDFYSLQYVEWTEDREKFFSSIFSSLEEIGSKIDAMKSNLNDKKINDIIAGNKFLLLNNK